MRTHLFPPTPFKDRSWGRGAAAAAGGPSALADPLPPLPLLGLRSALSGPLAAPGVRVLLLSLRLQLLVALASELRRLCSVNKLSDPRPQIHLFAHTQFLASAVALDPGGGGCVQTCTASLRALPDDLGLI